jgi:hypothetical protein
MDGGMPKWFKVLMCFQEMEAIARCQAMFSGHESDNSEVIQEMRMQGT